MSTATGLEHAGRMSLGWRKVAAVGTGLLIAALIIGLLLQRGGDDVAAPIRAAGEDATLPEATADYGIRHLQRSEARSFDGMADYGIRHLSQPGPRGDAQSRARGGELDASADYGVRHAQQIAPSLESEADYAIRHPQQFVRSSVPEDDYGVRNGTPMQR